MLVIELLIPRTWVSLGRSLIHQKSMCIRCVHPSDDQTNFPRFDHLMCQLGGYLWPKQIIPNSESSQFRWTNGYGPGDRSVLFDGGLCLCLNPEADNPHSSLAAAGWSRGFCCGTWLLGDGWLFVRFPSPKWDDATWESLWIETCWNHFDELYHFDFVTSTCGVSTSLHQRLWPQNHAYCITCQNRTVTKNHQPFVCIMTLPNKLNQSQKMTNCEFTPAEGPLLWGKHRSFQRRCCEKFRLCPFSHEPLPKAVIAVWAAVGVTLQPTTWHVCSTTKKKSSLQNPTFARGESRISFDMLKSLRRVWLFYFPKQQTLKPSNPQTLKPKTQNPKT